MVLSIVLEPALRSSLRLLTLQDSANVTQTIPCSLSSVLQDSIVVIAIYVDDIILISNDVSGLAEVKVCL